MRMFKRPKESINLINFLNIQALFIQKNLIGVIVHRYGCV